MVATVHVDADGSVTVSVENDEADDETTRPLVGLVLDDLLHAASKQAIATWLTLRATDESDDSGD